MLASLTGLLVCQLLGEILSLVMHRIIPGPVIGMALLFAFLLIRGGVPAQLESTSSELLRHLSLLFVPAGVGVVMHLDLLASEWLPIAAALVPGTLLTIAVTGLVMQALAKPQQREDDA